MNIVKTNINNIVWVKLTKTGINILAQQHKELKDTLPTIIGKFKLPETDSKGYSKFQLWDLMFHFGHYLENGVELPFEPDIFIEMEDINLLTNE